MVGASRWKTPEELMRFGFVNSRVVMMNEAHAGFLRSVRTRDLGRRLLPEAYGAGARYFAMEALLPETVAESNRMRKVPAQAIDAYLVQPEMRELVQQALDLGFRLLAYEADVRRRPEGLDLDAQNNWREEEQARNLASHLSQLEPDARVLVWCGNGHLYEGQFGSWIPMGVHLRRMSGVDPFTIDQTRTVDFPGRVRAPEEDELVAAASQNGGVVGLLAVDAGPSLRSLGVDAFIGSVDNAMQ